jgi:hypothetical protein
MFTLTTPRAILLGFLAVALAVGSIPFGMKLMDVNAQTKLQRVQICGYDHRSVSNDELVCVGVQRGTTALYARP